MKALATVEPVASLRSTDRGLSPIQNSRGGNNDGGEINESHHCARSDDHSRLDLEMGREIDEVSALLGRLSEGQRALNESIDTKLSAIKNELKYAREVRSEMVNDAKAVADRVEKLADELQQLVEWRKAAESALAESLRSAQFVERWKQRFIGVVIAFTTIGGAVGGAAVFVWDHVRFKF